MSRTAADPRAFLLFRSCALLPYAAAAAGLHLAPTQALLLGLVLELMFASGTKPWNLAARHLCLWGTLLFLLPDAFPFWLAPLVTILLALTHRWWGHQPRLAALWVVVLALPAMVDMLARLDPDTEVANAAARNPWLALESHTAFGAWAQLPHPAEDLRLDLVIPSRLQPWPLQADQGSRYRAGALVLLAFLVALWLSRRSSPVWVPLYLAPVLLTWALTLPRTSLQIWVPQADGNWQLLTLDEATRSALLQEGPGETALELLSPGSAVSRPGKAVSWVERGALIAPRAGGDPAYWPFLRHWSDARLEPGQRSKASGVGWQSPRRWEIDAQGHFILRPLP